MKTAVFLKRAILFLLIGCMIASLGSCAKEEKPDPGPGTEENGSPEAQNGEEPAETEAKPNITDQKFGGEDFNIAYMTGGSYGMGNEVGYTLEESETTLLSSAVYERNRLSEEALDIKIVGEFIDPVTNNFNSIIFSLVQSGDPTYEAVLNYLQNNYALVTQGALLNLRGIDTVCLDNPWWDQGINNAYCFFGSKQFFATGDICIDDDCTTDVYFFDKKLETDFNLPDHYAEVQSGTWTLDKMLVNMEAVTNDLNGDGAMNQADSFGMGLSIGGVPTHMIYFGAPSTITDEEGCPQFAYIYQSEKLVNTFEAVFDGLIVNPSVTFVERDLAGDYTGVNNMFYNDQLLYKLGAIGSMQGMRDQMEGGFGVIPPPKLNAQQDNYYTAGSPAASTYAFPVTVEKPEQNGAILNAMGYFSVDTITENVIQKVVMIRNTRDEESEQMLRFALANKIYDVGWCLQFGDYRNKLYEITNGRTNTFVSTMESIKNAFNEDVKELIEVYGGEE